MEGEPNGRTSYRFGDAKGNEIPADYVEPLLRKLRAEYGPQKFGERLAEVYALQAAGVEVKASKPRKARAR